MFLVGPSLSVVDAFRHLKEQFGIVGLQIQDQKCEMYSPLPSAIPSTSVIGDIHMLLLLESKFLVYLLDIRNMFLRFVWKL